MLSAAEDIHAPVLASRPLLVPTLLLLLPVAAEAQGIAPPSTASPVTPAVRQHDTGTKPAELPPPALPGAQSSAETVVPADKGTLDLPPTESLFDAIHRGDMVAARDALSRGADLDGHNVLGQTPLDLSIDLNRNDITFLLLSMRTPGDDGRRGPPPAAAPVVAERVAPPPRRGRAGRNAPSATPEATLAAATPAAQRPQLFAGDGGAPKPSVGFLGFGGAR